MAKQILPLVSIIMPAHNAERFIEAAIRSVLAQHYQHWELLVIDDASTDNTAERVQHFQDERIRYHRVERIGAPAGVRNIGLQRAQGEFIAFLDADDLYLPDALEILTSCLLQNPQLTAAYGFALCMDETENPLPQDLVLEPGLLPGTCQLPPGYPVQWKRILAGDFSCQLPTLMLRRETLQRVGFFNEDLCGPEDYEFFTRLYLDYFEGVACLPAYIYRYRIYANSLTKAPEHVDRILQSALRIKDWLFTEAPLPEGLQQYKSRSYLMCFRYFARERLLHHQAAMARQLILAALKHPAIKTSDWLRDGLALLLRSYFPSSLNQWLITLRRALLQPSLPPLTLRRN